jgi:predicted TIM-barrel fold metal-dependent hydrolase
MENIITLEEHFLSEAFLAKNSIAYAQQINHVPGLSEKLRDLGPIRLKHMDAGNISIQVISHGPGKMSPDECHTANNELAKAVSKNDRFAGFAVLPMEDPREAAEELKRCVYGFDFVGALIDNHSAGTYYDGSQYRVFWETVQELDVPIYLHPTWPTDTMRETLYSGNFQDSASLSLGASGWGWHSDVALHVFKLFAAGTFDAFPRLKIIIGHMGEMIPFMLDRILQLSPRWGTRERDFRTVWDENIWITTSGVWSVDPMACILRNTKIDHILYSVDYPFAKNEDGLEFLKNLQKSGLVDEQQFGQIVSGNAAALLGLEDKIRK